MKILSAEEPIYGTEPSGKAPEDISIFANEEVTFGLTVVQTPTGQRLVLGIESFSSPDIVDGDAANGYFITINRNVNIDIKLSALWDWKFARSPITFKIPKDAENYTTIDNGHGKKLHKIHARLAAGLPNSHYFNLNVQMAQGDGTQMFVLFDPRMDNPPGGKINDAIPQNSFLPI